MSHHLLLTTNSDPHNGGGGGGIGGGGSVFFSEESKFREVKQLTCGHIAQWQNKDLILLLCKICHDL